MTESPDPKFLKDGYKTLAFSNRGELIALRNKFVEQFDRLSRFHNLDAITDDAGVVALYRNAHRDLWVAVVDQLPLLTEVMGLSGHPQLVAIARQCGIRVPAMGCVGPTILANMPNDNAFLYAAHQDISFIPGSLNGVTIWIPLQDAPLEIGPLEVIPGSHREGMLRHNNELDVKRSRLIPMPADSEFVPLPIELGQAIVFSKFIVHRSGANVSDTIRFSIQVRFNDLGSPEYAQRKLSLAPIKHDSHPTYHHDR